MNGAQCLEWLQSRRSVRVFEARAVEREVLERILHAATSAPSSTNRQPWRFSVVTSQSLKRGIAEAVQLRADAMKAIVQRGHHAEDLGGYTDFFHEPLQTAAVIIIPQYRDYPDLMAKLLESGGADPANFTTAAAMQAELCSTSAAVMNLLLQAHAEGLGACWMAGPMVARDDIRTLLGIKPPWHMLGAVALGFSAEAPSKKPRKELGAVVQWLDKDTP